MGLLVDGQWHDKWYDTEKHGGRFVRSESQFRDQITADGRFKPESGRYHLYTLVPGLTERSFFVS